MLTHVLTNSLFFFFFFIIYCELIVCISLHVFFQWEEFYPEKLVLLFDQQDSQLSALSTEGLECFYAPTVSFQDAAAVIKSYDVHDTDTLFIMLCGITSVFQDVVEEDCTDFHCRPPLVRLSLLTSRSTDIFNSFLTEALELRRQVAYGSRRKNVLFSGLLPVDIRRLSQFEVENHLSATSHHAIVHPKSVYASYQKALDSGVEQFNAWAKEDAAGKGFPFWDLDQLCTETSCQRMCDDGRSLTSAVQNARRKGVLRAALKTKELLLSNLKRRSQVETLQKLLKVNWFPCFPC